MMMKPFSKIPLIKYFQHDLEKIKMAFRLSDSIRSDLRNIRAAGNEVELAVKQFFKDKLYPKYHVCGGHIIDSSLKTSPQYDIIICENAKNPVLFELSDDSELVYFETVYCFAEVKRSFYAKDLVDVFSENIRRTRLELKRENIAPTFMETSNTGFYIEEPLTSLPLRNPLLAFIFFIETSTTTFEDIGKSLKNIENENLPNFIVLLDTGIIVNINRKLYENNKVKINLYPEYEKEDNLWVLIDLGGENNVLTFQYMLVLEHLNNSIVSSPDIRNYTKNIFDFSITNVHKL
jgi:hypothetical protein